MEEVHRCVECSGGLLAQRCERVDFPRRGRTVVIDDVPVWRCLQCGALSYDAVVYQRMAMLAKQTEGRPDDVEPLSFSS